MFILNLCRKNTFGAFQLFHESQRNNSDDDSSAQEGNIIYNIFKQLI